MEAINCVTYYRYHKVHERGSDITLYDAKIFNAEQNMPGYEMHLVLMPEIDLMFAWPGQLIPRIGNLFYRGYLIRFVDADKKYSIQKNTGKFDVDVSRHFESHEAALFFIDELYENENLK